jgi:hypothetical protein
MKFTITQEIFGETNKKVKLTIMSSIGISSPGERLQAHDFEVYLTCSVPNLERDFAQKGEMQISCMLTALLSDTV